MNDRLKFLMILTLAGVILIIGFNLATSFIQPKEATSFTKEEIRAMHLEKIDINAASAEQLAELPHFGIGVARHITNYRDAHGDFEKIEDVDDVDGIGELRLRTLKLYCEVKEKPNNATD